MPGTNEKTEENNNGELPEGGEKKTTTPPEDDVERRIEERLKPIKSRLDAAFAERDEARKKLATLEAEAKEARAKQLDEEGKHKDAYEIRLKEKDARLAELEKRNVELARDATLNAALSGLDFRTQKAKALAYNEIVGQLVQDEKGQWVHKSGKDIGVFVSEYAASEDSAFLFKPKQSSGAGSGTRSPKGDVTTPPTSLFAMSQEDVLKMARAGKLRRTQ